RDARDAGGVRPAGVARAGAQPDRAAQVRPGIVEDGRRRRVVDEPVGDRCRRGLVAGDVVGDRAEVVVAVGDGGGVAPDAARHGGVVAAPMRAPEPLPAGAPWKSTWSTPEPESAAEPSSVFVPRRYWPGSFWLVVGGVLSTRTFVTAAEVAVLPATSRTTMR